MNWYEASITKHVKAYDRDLFCEKNMNGVPCVFRKAKRFVTVFSEDDFTLLNLITGKDLVFALTEDWSSKGKPCEWGIDNVLNRLKEHDGWNNEDLLSNIEKQEEQFERSKVKDLQNNAEAFFSDYRSEFKKAWGDVLTHSLPKTENKKRLRDRRIKNADY